mmetsp:Transcript_17131/g.34749  ORF Transcript_17131/g.34749 Transcript_17131/m.34749 type:complete len:271 (+) Transcript_17131:253-1065(+)
MVHQSVSEDPLALMPPELQELFLSVDNLGRRRGEDALEDAGEVAQVEDVVELGGSGQHLGLGLVPDINCDPDEPFGGIPYLFHPVRRLGVELGSEHGSKDLVDRGDGRQGDVHHVEVPLGAVGDVVLAAARVQHGAQEEKVDHVLPLPRLVEVVHSLVLDELPHDLQSDLVAPSINLGHRDVVDEDDHLLAPGRTEGAPLPLLDAPLDGPLEDDGRGGRREGQLLNGGRGGVLLAEHRQDDTRLGGAWPAHEKHWPPPGHRELHIVLAAH